MPKIQQSEIDRTRTKPTATALLRWRARCSAALADRKYDCRLSGGDANFPLGEATGNSELWRQISLSIRKR
jgi:hypothetical protein